MQLWRNEILLDWSTEASDVIPSNLWQFFLAPLCCAVMCSAVLCCVVLCSAVLCYVVPCCLCCAVLCCACCVVLYYAVLCRVVLCCAVLSQSSTRFKNFFSSLYKSLSQFQRRPSNFPGASQRLLQNYRFSSKVFKLLKDLTCVRATGTKTASVHTKIVYQSSKIFIRRFPIL